MTTDTFPTTMNATDVTLCVDAATDAFESALETVEACDHYTQLLAILAALTAASKCVVGDMISSVDEVSPAALKILDDSDKVTEALEIVAVGFQGAEISAGGMLLGLLRTTQRVIAGGLQKCSPVLQESVEGAISDCMANYGFVNVAKGAEPA